MALIEQLDRMRRELETNRKKYEHLEAIYKAKRRKNSETNGRAENNQ